MEAEQTNEQIPFKIVPLDGDGAEEALEMILNGEAGAVQDWVEEGGDPNAWIQVGVGSQAFYERYVWLMFVHFVILLVSLIIITHVKLMGAGTGGGGEHVCFHLMALNVEQSAHVMVGVASA